MIRARGVTFVMAAGLMAVVLLGGCAGAAGFPASKDTTLVGVKAVTAATCESLFGKASDVARAIKLDRPDGFKWTQSETSAATPLTCGAADAPVTAAIGLYVNSGDRKCDPASCGEASNGFWVNLDYARMNGTLLQSQKLPDSAAATKWLTEAATHVK